MKTVCVLGAGPAGLFAAHTAEAVGCSVVIISKKFKSPIIGAQYLHQPVLELNDPHHPDGMVGTYLFGTKENYVERVYGDRNAGSHWQRLSTHPVYVPAWNLRAAYDKVWSRYEPQIVDQEVTAADVDEFTANFEVVISTIPQWRICEHPDQHRFESVPIVVKQQLECLPPTSRDDNFVVYNGSESGDWYRTSRIFGFDTTEGVANPRNEQWDREHWDDVGYKVVGNNCDCHPNLIRTGRHGLWERGILTHHTVEHTINAIYGDSDSIQPSASGGAGVSS